MRLKLSDYVGNGFSMETPLTQALEDIALPTSATELLGLIQTLPKEQGLPLLKAHWALLLPKDPGISLVSCWGSFQIRRR